MAGMQRMTHPAALPIDELLPSVEISRRKASGPGGQRRNKVATGVRLTHRPTGISAQASERRTPEDNRRVALLRLRRRLALELREPLDAERYRSSALWRRRTEGPRLAVAADHPDVPALVAEALDVLAALDDEVPAAAELLGVTTSRLAKVLALDGEALSRLNARLAAAGRATWR